MTRARDFSSMLNLRPVKISLSFFLPLSPTGRIQSPFCQPRNRKGNVNASDENAAIPSRANDLASATGSAPASETETLTRKSSKTYSPVVRTTEQASFSFITGPPVINVPRDLRAEPRPANPLYDKPDPTKENVIDAESRPANPKHSPKP